MSDAPSLSCVGTLRLPGETTRPFSIKLHRDLVLALPPSQYFSPLVWNIATSRHALWTSFAFPASNSLYRVSLQFLLKVHKLTHCQVIFQGEYLVVFSEEAIHVMLVPIPDVPCSHPIHELRRIPFSLDRGSAGGIFTVPIHVPNPNIRPGCCYFAFQSRWTARPVLSLVFDFIVPEDVQASKWRLQGWRHSLRIQEIRNPNSNEIENIRLDVARTGSFELPIGASSNRSGQNFTMHSFKFNDLDMPSEDGDYRTRQFAAYQLRPIASNGNDQRGDAQAVWLTRFHKFAFNALHKQSWSFCAASGRVVGTKRLGLSSTGPCAIHVFDYAC